ncbi:Uncharacterised protein [Bordetella pertussis]|nr:Uncharacterised protein [Bordetella pertussis]
MSRVREGVGQQLRHLVDRAQRRAQHQRAARTGFQQGQQILDEALDEAGRLRLGHIARHEQQALRGVVEWRLPTSGAGILQAKLPREMAEITINR